MRQEVESSESGADEFEPPGARAGLPAPAGGRIDGERRARHL